MPRKCGGGKKKLGISCNFPTEGLFLKHIREICASCYSCASIGLKRHMTKVNAHYLCSDCSKN